MLFVEGDGAVFICFSLRSVLIDVAPFQFSLGSTSVLVGQRVLTYVCVFVFCEKSMGQRA